MLKFGANISPYDRRRPIERDRRRLLIFRAEGLGWPRQTFLDDIFVFTSLLSVRHFFLRKAAPNVDVER